MAKHIIKVKFDTIIAIKKAIILAIISKLQKTNFGLGNFYTGN